MNVAEIAKVCVKFFDVRFIEVCFEIKLRIKGSFQDSLLIIRYSLLHDHSIDRKN